MKTSNRTLLVMVIIIVIAFVAGLGIVNMKSSKPGWERVLLAQWSGTKIVGDGKVITKTLILPSFRRLNIGGIGEVAVMKGKPRIVITTDQNLIPYIRVYTLHGVLYVGPAHNIELQPTAKLQIEIYTPQPLPQIQMGGAMRLSVSDITGDSFELMAGGATKSVLAGKVEKLAIKLAGACKVDASKLQSDYVNVKMAGAGEALVRVSRKLRAVIAGAGKVSYYGNPSSVSQRIFGAGKVTKIE